MHLFTIFVHDTKGFKRENGLENFKYGFTDTHCHLDFMFERAGEKYGDVDKYFSKVLNNQLPPTFEGIFIFYTHVMYRNSLLNILSQVVSRFSAIRLAMRNMV